MSFDLNKKLNLIKVICENQQAIDDYFIDNNTSTELRKMGRVIRPQKLYNVLKRYGNYFIVFYRFLQKTWNILFIFYNMALFFKFLKYIEKRPKYELSQKVILKYIDLDEKVYTKYFDGYSILSNIYRKKKTNYILNNLTLRVLIKSFIESICIYFLYRIKYLKEDIDVLQTYIIFETIIHYNSLKNIKDKSLDIKEVVIFNHYDRWIYVFTFIFKNITIFQHGLVDDRLKLPNKILNIKQIYVYDKQYENIFNNFLKSKTTFKLYDNRVKLVRTPLYNKNKINILIINQFSTVEFDTIIVKELMKNSKLNIMFKCHPKIKKDFLKKTDKNINIVEDFVFVDWAITYNSTLGDQYEEAGVKVYRYKINSGSLDFVDFNNFIASVMLSKNYNN